MPLFLDAQEKWDDFLENKITNYEKLRNFDYGPTNKSSVSKLSPYICLLYTSPSPRDRTRSRMPSSA